MQSLIQNLVSLTPLKRLIAQTIQTQLSKYIVGIDLEELADLIAASRYGGRTQSSWVGSA